MEREARMHELGIVIQIVKQIEAYMDENRINDIQKLVLQIGALSGVYHKYIEDVYPIAVEKSKLRDTILEIESTPAIVSCYGCGLRYNITEIDTTCPRCKLSEYEVISGTEFMIKEIHVKE